MKIKLPLRTAKCGVRVSKFRYTWRYSS